MRLAALILCAAVAPASVRAAEKPFDVRFAETYARHLVKMDADYLADVFRKHEETNLWQTEFWGKYMHSAVPLVKRFPNAELEGHIRSSAKIVMDSQLDDGYIGNYRADRRAQGGWDVWGVKYTLMGLLYYHDLTHEERPLACARRLADWLIGEVGPGGKRRIVTTGNYCGMPSCSVLEPIVWLYRETKDRRYLAFAEEIVREVGYDDDGPRLVRQALAGVPVAERGKWTGPWWDGCKDNAMKAYEMMSCYQGMLDFVDEKVKVKGEGEGERLEEIRRAAVMTAEDILAHEINIVGGAGSVEFWYGGAAHETLPYAHQNETCVTITWLRLCQRLFGLTGDEKWRTAFRRTFFNVYLGAISPDCSRFAAYPALQGRRTFYREHCHMTTDCCNQNGMRGYVAALEMGVIAGDAPERVHAVKDPRGAWGLVEKDGTFAVRCGELVMAFVGPAAAIPVEREEFKLDEAKSAFVPFAFVGSEVYRTWAEVVRHPWTGRLETPVAIDFARTDGAVKPVNGIGQPPMVGALSNWSMMHYLKEAGIPYARLHDVGGVMGAGLYVDIPNVFPDFAADENDPGNYRFAYTDDLLKALTENGVEPFFRLGVTIENFVGRGLPPVNSVPPKDFAKWARICEHVIRHYTEGWSDGFHHKIAYWEIWNEPDNMPEAKLNPLWQAEFSDYIRFYGVVAPYLKAKFPHLKIGGYGSCGFYAGVGAGHVAAAHSSPRMSHFVDCAHAFLKAVRDNRWPLDFFSYHSYSGPSEALRQVAFADSLLNTYGFSADRTERIFNEWLPGPRHEALGTAQQAAEIAAEMIGLQNGPCDLACIYDGRCGVGNYSPLFNPRTYEPHKAYYVFKAFHELRKLGRAVRPPKTPDGIAIAAATDGNGACAVLIANVSGGPCRLSFDFGSRRIQSAKVIDDDRSFVDAPFAGNVGGNSVWLLFLK